MAPSHTIIPLGNNTMDITMPIEWYGLGRDVCMRYAERIAEAVTLESRWRATSAVVEGVDHLVRVKLSRSRE